MFGCAPCRTDRGAFAADAAAWLAAHAPAMRARLAAAADDAEHFAANRAWQQELFDGGWAGISWPVEYGGRGGDPGAGGDLRRGAGPLRGECGVRRVDGRHGRPRCCCDTATTRSGRGTSGRCSAPTRRGASCSASRVRAATSRTSRPARCATATSSSSTVRRCGRRTRICCDFAILLARTNPDVPKHRGISFLLLDLRTPGVEVRPLRQITGASHFNEVFLTDVHVPVENVVGGIDNGWAVARAVLAHEASVIGGGQRRRAGIRRPRRARARRSAAPATRWCASGSPRRSPASRSSAT